MNNTDWKFIDAHTHLSSSDFDNDRDEVISRAERAGIFMIDVGDDIPTSEKVVENSVKSTGNIKAVVGIHPTYKFSNVIAGLAADSVPDFTAEYNKLLELAKKPEVVAVGECGLDYFGLENSVDNGNTEKIKAIQKALFEMQIKVANEVNKPLMLHIRNGKNDASKTKTDNTDDAYADVLEILKNNPAKAKGNVHFFAGTLEDAKKFFEIGFTISFTGVITFARNYDEVIRQCPMNMILSETDAPFVAPVPYRGKRNEPFYVIEVVKKMAEIKGVSVEEMAAAIKENTINLFKL